MVKLNSNKIKWLVKQVVNKGKLPREVASVYGLSVRRVQQLVKHYKDTGAFLMLNPNRREKKYLDDLQKQAILDVFKEVKLSPRLLYYELKYRGKYVPKNKLYEFMKEKGLVTPDPKKQKKRKRCRYEWTYSGDMLHGDAHRTSINHPYVMFWLDDASRKILAGEESLTPANNDMSIRTFKQAILKAKELNVYIKRCNTDRGTEFFSNQKEKNSNSKSKFEEFLISEGIKHIPSRRNNPQTNGKLERHWREYDKHRENFETLQDYINWYNNRLHGALDLETAETPNKGFLRKIPPESLIGLLFKEVL